MSKLVSRTLAVACRSSHCGEPTILVYELQLTAEQIANDEQIEVAQERAEEDNYEGPFVVFDSNELEPIFLATAEISHIRSARGM